MSRRKARAEPIAGGKPCPKCPQPMQRYRHPPEWQPRPGRDWFLWWDYCKPCGHMQMYEAARQRAKPADAGEPTTGLLPLRPAIPTYQGDVPPWEDDPAAVAGPASSSG